MLPQGQDFELLYKTFYPALCKASNNITHDKEAAHDIVQEVFVKLYMKRETLHEIENIRAYLYRAVINSSINHYKSAKRKAPLTVVPEDYSTTADGAHSGNELSAQIRLAIDKLPEKCRAIFVLSRFEDMKYKAIAEMLGVSVKTVENQMGIALKKLRGDLAVYLRKDLLSILVAFFSLISDLFF